MRSRVLICAALLLVAGCSSDDEPKAATSTTAGGKATTTVAADPTATTGTTFPTTTPEQAPKLPDRYVAEAITEAELGEPVDLGDGLTVTISDPTIEKDDLGPWIEVQVVADNASTGRATTAPAVELVCSGLEQGGGNLDGQSYPAGEPLAPGGSAKGAARLILPGDGRFGDPERCLYPAYVRLDVAAPSGDPVQRRFDLSEKLIADLNDQVAERLCDLAPSGCVEPED